MTAKELRLLLLNVSDEAEIFVESDPATDGTVQHTREVIHEQEGWAAFVISSDKDVPWQRR